VDAAMAVVVTEAAMAVAVMAEEAEPDVAGLAVEDTVVDSTAAAVAMVAAVMAVEGTASLCS
jgi:hypothetical protein